MKDELKTLKDIGWDDSGFGDYLYTKDVLIKELGIKWIKKLKEEDEKCESFIELFDRDPDAIYGAMFILKKIFDISEKDLE